MKRCPGIRYSGTWPAGARGVHKILHLVPTRLIPVEALAKSEAVLRMWLFGFGSNVGPRREQQCGHSAAAVASSPRVIDRALEPVDGVHLTVAIVSIQGDRSGNDEPLPVGHVLRPLRFLIAAFFPVVPAPVDWATGDRRFCDVVESPVRILLDDFDDAAGMRVRDDRVR